MAGLWLASLDAQFLSSNDQVSTGTFGLVEVLVGAFQNIVNVFITFLYRRCSYTNANFDATDIA